jgi:hypothetical protein
MSLRQKKEDCSEVGVGSIFNVFKPKEIKFLHNQRSTINKAN